MSVTEMTSVNLKPVYNVNPDMRFATTFISNKYRDYAINGEVIMDKATGEIFTKRPQDGRVVSFFQNKKYMSQLMLDLRIMLNNNAAFTYPLETDLDAYYLSTDYDMMSIYNNTDKNILTNNHTIPNGSNSVTKLQFNLSKKSNGFFIRLTSRDSDKAIIEWITNQYNIICKNYTGSDSAFLAEKEKFNAIEKWYDSNAVIEYKLSITTSGTTRTFDLTDYVRINEDCGVIFPNNTITQSMLSNASNVSVVIKNIRYDKLQFMYSKRSSLGSSFTSALSKFSYDSNIYIRYCNICSFIDSSSQINLLGNEFIIAMMDVPYVRRHMMKMSKLTNESNVIVSPNRPTEDLWSTNGIWAEQIRDVFKGGYTIQMENEVDLKQLEMYLAENNDIDYVDISTSSSTKGIYGKV